MSSPLRAINLLSLDVERMVKGHLARFLEVAEKIPYGTLRESNSQFESGLSLRLQNSLRSWLRSSNIVAADPRKVGLISALLDELRGPPQMTVSQGNMIGPHGLTPSVSMEAIPQSRLIQLSCRML